LTRRCQHLKKGPIGSIFRIAVAAAVSVTSADPRLEPNSRLPAGFADEGAGTLCQCSPRAALQYAPNQEIEFTGVLGIQDLSVICPVRRNFNFPRVSGSNCSRTVIGLKHSVAVIHVAKREHPQCTRTMRSAYPMVECAVVHL